MSRNKRPILARKKQLLLKKIAQQRAELSEASGDWLKITAPYDRAWHTVVAFRPIFIAASGLVSIYALKKPKSLLVLGKKMLVTWNVIRTIKNVVNSSKS